MPSHKLKPVLHINFGVEVPVKIRKYITFVALLYLSGLSAVNRPPTLSLSDAITYTIDNQLEIKISQLNFEAQKGVVRNAAGPFDPVFNGDASYTEFEHLQAPCLGIRTSKQGHETIGFISAFKKARSGTVATLSAQVDQLDNFFVCPKATNIGTITFRIEQPLLRDFMYSLDTVNEIAAKYELSAVFFDNLQNISQQILNTTLQYWEVVGLQNLITINKQAEERIIKLTEEIKQLIKEDQLARTDIDQPLAQIERQRLVGIELSQNLYDAVQTLKFNMGDIDLRARDPDFLLAIDDFPPVQLDVERLRCLSNEMIHFATNYRYNIQASIQRQFALTALLEGAYNQVLPEVNLRGVVSSRDFRRGNSAEPILKPLKLKNPQTNWTIGVHVSVPLYNDAALGNLKTRQSQRSQATLATQLIVQETIADLREAIFNQIALANELTKARALVELNQTLITNERKKLLEGFSTLFVLLDFENRLTLSLSDEIEIRKQFVQNIARIRFLTGTLLRGDCTCGVEVLDVTTLPGFEPLIAPPSSVEGECDG